MFSNIRRIRTPGLGGFYTGILPGINRKRGYYGHGWPVVRGRMDAQERTGMVKISTILKDAALNEMVFARRLEQTGEQGWPVVRGRMDAQERTGIFNITTNHPQTNRRANRDGKNIDHIKWYSPGV